MRPGLLSPAVASPPDTHLDEYRRKSVPLRGGLIEQVTELFFFGAQIVLTRTVRRRKAGNALGNHDPGAFNRVHFVGVIRKQANARDAEIPQNSGGKTVVAKVGVETKLLVRLDRIGAGVLQFVGAQFVQQTDAAPFLMLVDEQSASFPGNPLQGNLELRAAIATQAVEYIAGETLGVNAHE